MKEFLDEYGGMLLGLMGSAVIIGLILVMVFSENGILGKKIMEILGKAV